ncbi:MAG: TetR/AcrR family transcriptional regulator [Candidatus Binataceae bacterium]
MAELAHKTAQDQAPNRFDRRREKTRADLLEAAETVIARKGYHDTRIADIATEADVGLGTFYLHFKTKNEIFIELIANGAQSLREQLAEAKTGFDSPTDMLRITISTILDAAAENPESFRIVFGHSPAFLDLMVRVHETFINYQRLARRVGACGRRACRSSRQSDHRDALAGDFVAAGTRRHGAG